MEQIKLERELDIIDENKAEKSKSNFEDFSSELIYEIFGFLDFYDVYEAFSNLNIRFENLLTNSAYPIKINLSLISKSTFQRYLTNIIIPYQHRIQSLHFFNPFIIDRPFSPVSLVLNLIRLESIIIDTFNQENLEKLLDHLTLLPNLYSLIIMPGHVTRSIQLYHLIFHLPVLKYCKLSLERSEGGVLIPLATTKFSPIKYLVINLNH